MIVRYVTILELKVTIGPNYLASSVARHLFFSREREIEKGGPNRDRGVDDTGGGWILDAPTS